MAGNDRVKVVVEGDSGDLQSALAESRKSLKDMSPLRRDRREQGKRLVDVAKEAGCSTGLVSMVESGYVPSPAMQRGIAAALGASVERYWPS